MKKQQGFTLIELVIVIIILGILSAFAVPKYISLNKQARVASIQGLAGNLKAAAAIVHAKAIVDHVVSGNVTIDGGSTVSVSASSYPTYDTIANALDMSVNNNSGYNVTLDSASNSTLYKLSDNCTVSYTLSPDDATAVPSVVVTTTGC